MRRVVYRVTAMCLFDEPCADCAIAEDERCGDPVSPHVIRCGSMMHCLSEDVQSQETGGVERDFTELF